jgi:hypothetical protein
MTDQAFTPGTHPVLACANAVVAALKDVADVDPMFMTVPEKKKALVGLAGARAQIDELLLRVLGSAGDVAEADGARDAGAWAALHTRHGRGEMRRDLRLAEALGEGRAEVARALREGEVNLDQARVIVDAIESLPDDLTPEIARTAEMRLIAEAAQFGPRELRIMGRRILDVVAPDVAEDAERRALEAEEAHASSVTRLTTRSRGDGTSDIHLRVADAVKNRLLTYLDAIANPRRADGAEAVNPDDTRSHPQKLGHAFVTFLESIDPRRLPLHGGDATTVLVTIDHESLLKGLKDSGLALVGDEPISAAQARRLACQAAIIPTVLGGASVVLDQGRKRRLFKGSQRKALAATQPTCRAEGCDIPSAWCEAHHGNGRWAEGAGTDTKDGVLFCSFHHHRAHDARYDQTKLPDGRVRFNKRT